MRSSKWTARILGLQLLVQMAGFIVPFILLHPIATADFLSSAAQAPVQIKVAVFLLLANCSLTVSIAIGAWPLFRQYSSALALLLVAVSVIMLLLQAVDNVHLLSMLSLSQRYIQEGGPPEIFRALAAMLGSTRRWAHYSELLAIDAWIFLFYSLLFRFALVPRTLAAFGWLTVVLHFTGITLPLFLGYRAVMPMGVPMAGSHLVLALWLMTKGFSQRHELTRLEANGIELSPT